jgi:hypothetical protein
MLIDTLSPLGMNSTDPPISLPRKVVIYPIRGEDRSSECQQKVNRQVTRSPHTTMAAGRKPLECGKNQPIELIS